MTQQAAIIELQQCLHSIAQAIKSAAASVEKETAEPPPLELRRASVDLVFAIEESGDKNRILVRVDAERLKSLPEHAVSKMSFELAIAGEVPQVES